MFHPITVPYGSVMLFNEVVLKEGITVDDVELQLGTLCNVVKNNYSNDGFIAGQVFRHTGMVSDEGSVNPLENDDDDDGRERLVIVTYWESFDQHEQSHADELFKEHFGELMEYCDSATERALELLWQGEAEETV